MYDHVMANVGVNFRFYRRNRLLIVATLLILFVVGLSTVPSLFLLTKSQHLSHITMITSELCGIANIIIPALGLLLVSQHLRNRSAKMVFTKPCPPETWLISSSISAITVAAVFYAGIFLICSSLFAIWSIPFQWGLFYVLLNNLAHALIWLAYLTFLAVVFHPVVAVLFVFIFQESTFFFLYQLLISGVKATGESNLAFFLNIARWLIDAIYMVLPMTNPFADESAKVYQTLRGADADWSALIATWGYVLGISLLFFLMANYFLKKKRLI